MPYPHRSALRRGRAGSVAGTASRPARRQAWSLARRLWPTVTFVARLTATAILAYGLAWWLPGVSRPLLAPLTALLVVRYTLYQTLRHAVQRLISVVAGVLVAVALSAAAGFTWWSLGFTIAAALVLGRVLRLGEHVLEVPISAMLVLSIDPAPAAADRVGETLIGAITGLLAGLLAAPVRVEPAESAIEELSDTMAGLLERLAEELGADPDAESVADWLTRARELGREIQRADSALEDAEESIRLNPRATGLLHAGIALRSGLETFEHAAVTIRGLTRSVADGTRPGDQEVPVFGEEARLELRLVLGRLSEVLRAYGRLVRADVADRHEAAEQELRRRLDSVSRHRNRLAELLHEEPVTEAMEWPLRGELLVHVDRLLAELRVEQRARHRERWRGRRPLQRHPRRAFLLRKGPRKPPRMRPRPGGDRDRPEE